MKKHYDKKGNEISNDEAIDAAIKSHTETFGPFCNSECLRAQLKGYYDKLCENEILPRGGKGTDIDETQNENK